MSESGLNMSGSGIENEWESARMSGRHRWKWAGWDYGLVKPVHKNFQTLIR